MIRRRSSGPRSGSWPRSTSATRCLLFLVVARRRAAGAKARIKPTMTMSSPPTTRSAHRAEARQLPRARLPARPARDPGRVRRLDRPHQPLVPEYGPFPAVKLLELPRGGKTVGQNQAAAIARGEILVFSDATTIYDARRVRALVANYADPPVGSVGGDVRYIREGEDARGKGRQMYWNYEASIRRWESRICTVIGATGCIYSMRKSLYTHLDPAAISDFVQPANALIKGYRSVVEDDATCYEVAESKQIGDELRRRARVVASRHPRHRLHAGDAEPAPAPVPALPDDLPPPAALGHPVSADRGVRRQRVPARPAGFYQLTFGCRSAFYGGALAAAVLDRSGVRPRGLFIPLYFCLVNLAPLIALWSLLKGEKKIVWETGPQAP